MSILAFGAMPKQQQWQQALTTVEIFATAWFKITNLKKAGYLHDNLNGNAKKRAWTTVPNVFLFLGVTKLRGLIFNFWIYLTVKQRFGNEL